MKCINCGVETDNPKFCSRSCNVTYNNKRRKKKTYTKECKHCATIFIVPATKKNRTVCDNCVSPFNSKRKSDLTQALTVQEIKDNQKNASRPWTDRIRGYARSKYKNKSTCIKCGYDKHVEVCHIKPIVNFSDSATVSEINDESNILLLCPNCHWEHDNL